MTLWDGAEACAVFQSGMAAISHHHVRAPAPGDVVLYSEPLYGGTDYFLNHILPAFGIDGASVFTPVPEPTRSGECIAASRRRRPARA